MNPCQLQQATGKRSCGNEAWMVGAWCWMDLARTSPKERPDLTSTRNRDFPRHRSTALCIDAFCRL